MNNDIRKQRIEHARTFLNKEISRCIQWIAASSFVILLVLCIFIFLIAAGAAEAFTENLLLAGTFIVVLILFIIKLCRSIQKKAKLTRLLNGIESDIEEVEHLEFETKLRVLKNKRASCSGASNADRRSIADCVYGDHGWRKTIPHSEYTKYHIRLENYETIYEYEDALRKAKNRYEKLHK